MSGRTAQRKGRAGELELTKILQSAGFPVHPGRSASYGTEPDLIGLEGIHIECKRVERLNVPEALRQAERDAEHFGDGAPTVFHRRNREPWMVTMRLTDWIELYKEANANMMTHWKKLTNPDYLGAYILEPGQEIIATIDRVQTEQVTGPDGSKSECIVAHFAERDIKPMILNVTNCKTITALTGSAYVEDWPGTKIQIYAAKVRAFGEMVEALRIRPTPPKESNQVPPCEDCGKPLPVPSAGSGPKPHGKRSCGSPPAPWKPDKTAAFPPPGPAY